ncbi:hypothetical protein M3E18_00625 [Kocuria sp. p3-SID1433]|uniref:YkvI family membrane protein n=1 Tax=unclassified Kocuria TaxID=2649579 RepID=UPI0021A8DEE9|nr:MULTISPECIES: hypothetical protein [unclassified Kocuria]MCT1600960.1 hypothetical protein [Kocuria sp. p3-SID1428]MCT2179064.1 hypothetical protein [Kocuria sp. p3-SID1433]
MRMRTVLMTALAFVGLVVGAGFSTGQEVIQYFISFGSIGIVGAVLSGVVMAVGGLVIVQLGSYFLAEDHFKVFRNVSHPVISRFLDVSVTLTMFAMGFIMVAGAGSTLQQHFGLPSWMGAGLMTLIVILVGQLDVDRVSSIISLVTPLVVLAVLAAFVYTMLQLPVDTSSFDEIARQSETPVRPWWLSGINYACMNMMLAVSMSLVIGGNLPNTREARWGGFLGGLMCGLLVVMAAVLLYLRIPQVADSSVPMLTTFETIHPAAASVMVVVIFLMIFNTTIGMFYALGRRLTAERPRHNRWVFPLVCLAGYAVSFVGFSTLMSYLYPVIGYVGMFMIALFVVWSVRRRVQIVRETGRRDRIRALLTLREDPRRTYTQGHEQHLERYAGESVADDEAITGAIDVEVLKQHQRDRSEQRDQDDTTSSTPSA